MSTIDMTQVAGLQTVDAEGNVIGTLSVDDLTNLVANNLVKSTQNQIAAARSVSTMSEASTLAASDDYENTLPIDANPASVRTLDAAGNPKQTGISALAQVVGGLIKPLKYKLITNMETLNKGLTSFDEPVVPFYTGYIPQVTPSSNYAGGLAFTYYGIEGEIQILFDYSGKINIRNRSSNDVEFGDFRTL